MRDDYEEFMRRAAVILAIGPNTDTAFRQYWENEKIPYIGLPDPEHKVARLYRQEVKIFKLGRMPLVCIVDGDGQIRYVHYGASMSDIPSNEVLLNVMDELKVASN